MRNRKYSFPRQIVAILVTWILLIPMFPIPTALAFMPNQAATKDTKSTGSATHESITEDVITKYDKKLFKLGNKPLTENMKTALKEIIEANGSVDDIFGREYLESAAHFDGDEFKGSQKRLTDFKLRVKDLMLKKKPDIKNARKYLGRALHTLQDFYSHSNWVELNRGAYYSDLGIPGKPLTNPPVNTLSCEDCVRNNCDECNNHLKATALTTGYYALRFDPIIGPTIESFETNRKPNDLKCSHGGKVIIFRPFPVATAWDMSGKGDFSAGINKDTKVCRISPHHEKHIDAAKAAALATEKYLDHIRVLIKDRKMKLLLGGGPTLAVTIDTTGSMENIIAQVKQQAIQIVSSRIGTDEEPSSYVLVPFNDPGVGPVIVTEDPYEFMLAISGLTATGGGDCPELSMTGALQALNNIEDEGGELMMFTDASSKDASLVGVVEGVAQVRGISISPMAFGSCSPIDPAYIRLANNTGGQVFVLSGNEAGTITQLAEFVIRSNVVDVLHVSGTLSGVAQTFDVPVDSTITRVTFSVSGTSNVVVTRPDNSVVQPTDPNVSRIALSSGAIYSLTSMPTGTWRVAINGTGDFSVRVVAESPLDFSFLNFVESGAGALHHGYFSIPGFPETNQTGTVLAQVSANANTAQFAFRNPDGSALQSLTLEEVGWANELPAEESFTVGPVRQFLGDITPPTTAFRTYVTGVDVNGIPYQRVKSNITKPQTVKITPPVPVDLTPGQPTSYIFKVTNTGASDTFSLTGSDDKAFLTSVSPTTLSLATGQTANVTVVLTPPSNAGDKGIDTLTLTAQSTGTSGAFNYARVTSDVLPTATLTFADVIVTERNGNKNGVIEAGEGGTISASLVNTGGSTASGISVVLTSTTPGVLIETGSSTYPNITPDGVATNTVPLTFSVNSGVVCGQDINLVLTATQFGGGPAIVQDVPVPIGVATGQPNTTQTISYSGPAVPIPDNSPSGVNIPVTVSGFTGSVADLDFKFDGTSCTTTAGATTVGLDHTWVGDLVVTLTSPQGKRVLLIDRPGLGDNSGNNFCNTRLDDETTGASVQDLITTDAPHTGTFKPATPLASFDGENPNGTWILNVSDRVGSDVGNVRAFSLVISDSSCDVPPADNTAPTCELTASNPGPPASVDVSVQDTGVGLAAINLISANNVDVVVPPFLAGETLPLVVTGTLINPNSNGSFEIQTIDMVGNVSSCTRTITGALPPKILFRTNRHGNYELYVMDTDGSNQTRVTNTTTDHYRNVWSPNGEKIAFSVERDGTNWWDILIANADGSNRVNLTQNVKYEFSFAYSRDGTKIAFESDLDGGPIALWVMNADGTGLTRLVNTGGSDQIPSWSPDGSKIAYVGYPAPGKSDIFVVGVDGSNPTNLTQTITDASESWPMWSPDGTKILFTKRIGSSLNPSDLYVMNANGSGLQRLTFNSIGAGAYDWSPGGTKIVFQSSSSGNGEIYVMNADGTGQVNITNHSGFDFGPRWSPDGLRILFHTTRDGNTEIYVMNANGSGQVNLSANAASDSSGVWRP